MYFALKVHGRFGNSRRLHDAARSLGNFCDWEFICPGFQGRRIDALAKVVTALCSAFLHIDELRTYVSYVAMFQTNSPVSRALTTESLLRRLYTD